MNKDYCEACHYELREGENQYCDKCANDLEEMISAQFRAWQREKREQQARAFEAEQRQNKRGLENHIRFDVEWRDYEPEQAYGSAADFRRHRQFGGTRENY